jgi:hypothetical protein
MIGLLADIRPDSWNFPLFLHVLGAMLLVGAVVAAAGALLTPAGAGNSAGLRRFAFRTLLLGSAPSGSTPRSSATRTTTRRGSRSGTSPPTSARSSSSSPSRARASRRGSRRRGSGGRLA